MKQDIKNPGTLQDIQIKCTSIFPLFFDGFRVIVHRGLSTHFRVTHSIYLSSITPGNYRFGATHVGNKMVHAHENVPVLFGDIDSRGNMNASIYHLFGSRFKLKFDSQMVNTNFVESQLTAHYFGNKWTASAILSNADFLTKSGCLVLHFLQSVTPKLALGAELSFLHNMVGLRNPEIMHSGSNIAVVGRYTTQHSIWCTQLSLHNILLSCYKQASEQIEFGLELNSNLYTNESVGSLAFRITLKDRGIIFRGSVDTNTNVGSVFEKRICGSPFAFSVSANLNHRSNNFRMGLGFIVE